MLGHRGAPGYEPENSLASFRKALSLGADGVELDVHTSASGHLIVHHDALIGGLGPIAELTLEQILMARLAHGEPIPTLPEALGAVLERGDSPGARGSREVWIELKSLPDSADGVLFAAIDGSPAPEACAVHSFDHRIVARIGAQRPSLRRGILSASYPIDPVSPMRMAGATTLWQEWHLVDSDLVAAIHGSGGEVIAWTVDDAETARWLRELGVDGLCGNWPERLKW